MCVCVCVMVLTEIKVSSGFDLIYCTLQKMCFTGNKKKHYVC